MIRRTLTPVIVALALGASTLGTAGVASAGGPPAKTFRLSGTVMNVNLNQHQFTVLTGATRYTVMMTTQTRFTLNAQTTSMYGLRSGLNVVTTGLFRARYRVALRVALRVPPPVTTSTTPANANLTTALTSVLSQERYALATYQNIVAKLGSFPPFTNISSSEQQHVATVTALMKAHGVSVPTTSTPGATAPTTRVAACQLGVTTETAVIATYQKAIPLASGFADVIQAFNNMLDVSQTSHLPAFLRCS